MRIEIITTPDQTLYETGFGGIKACNGVLKSIKKMGHSVVISLCETEDDLIDVKNRVPDLVVLATKYLVVTNNPNIWLSTFFENNNIAFTGSSFEVLQFDSDKVLAKERLKELGIRTADYFTALPGQYRRDTPLPVKYPIFLKPIESANGNGIDDESVVKNFDDFESKVSSLFETYRCSILAEEYLDGKEFTVAILSKKNQTHLISAVDILPPVSSQGFRILGEKAKTENTEIVSKSVDNQLKQDVEKVALDSFCGLGSSGFGRIDIKTNAQGEYFFMEANLVPGMMPETSYFPRACAIEHGLDYDEVVKSIVEESLHTAGRNADQQLISDVTVILPKSTHHHSSGVVVPSQPSS